MEILYVIIGLLLGAVVAYFALPRKVEQVEASSAMLSSESAFPQYASQSSDEEALQRELSELRRQVEELTEERGRARDELRAAESKLRVLQQSVDASLESNGSSDGVLLTQLKELRQQMEELEEEKEDMEDDLRRAKNKTNELTEELQALNLVKEKAQKLEAEIDMLKEAQQDLMEDKELKTQALSFVKEVLQAKPYEKQEGVSEAHAHIDDFVHLMREDFDDVLKLAGRDPHVYSKDLNRWIASKKKPWLDGKISIAFVGEFSAGKTSIVNRLLSDDKEGAMTLPVSAKATTAIPTYISRSEKVASFSIVCPDDVRKIITKEVFEGVKKEVLDEVGGLSSLIKYFVMGYDNEALANMSILDTPGFSSNDAEDAQRTIEVINESDALFWVFDVNAGTINQKSLEIIKEHLKKPLYIIINKVDSKSPGEVKEVEALIRKTLEDKGVNFVKILPFSQKESLDDLKSVLREVQPGNSSSSFLEVVMQPVDEMVANAKKYLAEIAEEKKKVIEVLDESKNLLDNNFDVLAGWCEGLASLPTYETHFFSSDKYEMSKEEGEEFFRLLAQIYNPEGDDAIDLLKTQIEEYKDASELYGVILVREDEVQDKHDRFVELQEKLKRSIAKLK